MFQSLQNKTFVSSLNLS